MKNKYVRRGKISEAKFRRLTYLFTLDLTAVQISNITNLNRNTVNRYLKGIRQRIAEYCEVMAPSFCRSHDPPEKHRYNIIGLKCRQQHIHLGLFGAEQLPQRSTSDRRFPEEDPVLYPLANSFDALYALKQEWKLYFNNPDLSKNELRRIVNRIDGFIGYSRARLQKFKGLRRSTLYLHLKECEFRYNHPKEKYYHKLLKILRNNPLF